VERSLVGYWRLQVRYERRADILLGFVHLACSPVGHRDLGVASRSREGALVVCVDQLAVRVACG
jgi:hypothetical protein